MGKNNIILIIFIFSMISLFATDTIIQIVSLTIKNTHTHIHIYIYIYIYKYISITKYVKVICIIISYELIYNIINNTLLLITIECFTIFY